MKELVETLVKALVKNPDAVSVTLVQKGSLKFIRSMLPRKTWGK